MVSAEARAELDRMLAAKRQAEGRRPEPISVEQERRNWEAAALETPLPEGARFQSVDAGGVPSEWVEMPDVKRGRVVLLLHGGGYTSGSPVTHRKLAANLGRAVNARVLVPHYRLAPEHPFPAGVEDAIKSYDWLLHQGLSEIVVAGDSAGGGLALSMLVALRDAGAKLPRATVLMSAWTDLTASSPSHVTHRDLDPQVTPEDLRSAGLLYVGAGDPAAPTASTLFADPTGLPPLLLQVGGAEVLLDDSRILAQRARAAGVVVTLRIFGGMWHVFQFHAPEMPEAQAAMDDIAAFIRAQLGD
ncbi:MAG: alpha/beta hydrolase [Devosia sp.]